MALPWAACFMMGVINAPLSTAVDLQISKCLVQQEGDMALQWKRSGFNFSFRLAKNLQYRRALGAFQ